MSRIFTFISAWFRRQGGFTHVVAGLYASGVAAYAAVPPFHRFIITIWAITPPFVRELALTATGLVAWYVGRNKPQRGTPNVG